MLAVRRDHRGLDRLDELRQMARGACCARVADLKGRGDGAAVRMTQHHDSGTPRTCRPRIRGWRAHNCSRRCRRRAPRRRRRGPWSKTSSGGTRLSAQARIAAMGYCGLTRAARPAEKSCSLAPSAAEAGIAVLQAVQRLGGRNGVWRRFLVFRPRSKVRQRAQRQEARPRPR